MLNRRLGEFFTDAAGPIVWLSASAGNAKGLLVGIFMTCRAHDKKRALTMDNVEC